MLQLAAIVDELGYKIAVLDNNCYRLPIDAVRQTVKEDQWDVIGIGGLITQYKFIKELLPVCREENPDAVIVGGGGFVSSMPREMMRWLPDLDIGVIGEGYITWREVLDHVDDRNWKRVKGLVYREGKKIKLSKMRPLIPEEKLDEEVPFPAYEFSPIETYLMNSRIPYSPEAMHPNCRRLDVLASLGCPWQCSFCLPKDTLILTADLQWVPIQSVKLGDKVMGVAKDGRTKFIEAVVTHVFTPRRAQVYKITTEHGFVKSTAEHPWLSDGGGRWRKTSQFKVGQYLRFVSQPIPIEVTLDYMKGYLVGAWKGDGTLIEIKRTNGTTDKLYPGYRLKLAGDYEMLDTAWSFANEIGLSLNKVSITPTKMYPNCNRALTKQSKFAYNFMKNLYATVNNANDEFKRGFLAGIFDAEGSWAKQGQLRISNEDPELLKLIGTFLLHFGFNFALEKKGIIVHGGYSEHVRFIALTQPTITHKKQALLGRQLCCKSKILNIELEDEQLVYNLETTTGNFIADGFVTHNCFHTSMTPSCQSQIYGKKVTGKEVRYFSPEYVVNLISHLRQTYCINFVSFIDENLSTNRKWFFEFCEKLEESGLATLIHWGMVCHTRTVDAELLQKGKDCGLSYISYGGETASEKLLQQMGKGQTKEQMSAAIQATQAAGINPIMSFICGFPNSTVDDLLEDVQFFIDNQIHVRPFLLQPYPATKLYKEYKDKIIDQYLTEKEKEFLTEPNKQTYLAIFDEQKLPIPSTRSFKKQTPILKEKLKNIALERWVLTLDDATRLSVNLTDFNDVELAGLRYMVSTTSPDLSSKVWDVERLKKFKKLKGK